MEVLCIHVEENSFLIISGYHLMVHLKGKDDSSTLTRIQEMIQLVFVTTQHSRSETGSIEYLWQSWYVVPFTQKEWKKSFLTQIVSCFWQCILGPDFIIGTWAVRICLNLLWNHQRVYFRIINKITPPIINFLKLQLIKQYFTLEYFQAQHQCY